MLFQQLLTDKSNANTDWNLGWISQTLLQSEVAHRNSANKGLVGATTTAPGPLCFMGTLKISQLTPRFGLQAAYALPHRDVSHPPMQKPGRPSDQLWPDPFFFFWGIDVCFFPGPCGSTRDSHFPVLSSLSCERKADDGTASALVETDHLGESEFHTNNMLFWMPKPPGSRFDIRSLSIMSP